jgi:hypothetical protein
MHCFEHLSRLSSEIAAKADSRKMTESEFGRFVQTLAKKF